MKTKNHNRKILIKHWKQNQHAKWRIAFSNEEHLPQKEIPFPEDFNSELDFTNILCQYLEYGLMPHHPKTANCQIGSIEPRNLILTVSHLLFQCRYKTLKSRDIPAEWKQKYSSFIEQLRNIASTYKYQAPEVFFESWERASREVFYLYKSHPNSEMDQLAALIWSRQEN